MRPKRKSTVLLLALVGVCLTVGPDVLAVVGMPATPVSYAGAARRTVRRSGYY
jgi:hypothetical protein